MKDPYLYDDVPVLRNKLGIKNINDLRQAEADITVSKLLELDKHIKCEDNNLSYEHLLKIHKYIFGDIYEWAGQPRTINIAKSEAVLNGLSVLYADFNSIVNNVNMGLSKLNNNNWSKLSLDEMVDNFSQGIAEIWKAHPFREGNTRSVVKFAAHYAKENGFPLKEDLFYECSSYIRNALVMASLGEYSETHYLKNIMKDAIKLGLDELTNKRINVVKERNNNINKSVTNNYDIEL